MGVTGLVGGCSFVGVSTEKKERRRKSCFFLFDGKKVKGFQFWREERKGKGEGKKFVNLHKAL